MQQANAGYPQAEHHSVVEYVICYDVSSAYVKDTVIFSGCKAINSNSGGNRASTINIDSAVVCGIDATIVKCPIESYRAAIGCNRPIVDTTAFQVHNAAII